MGSMRFDDDLAMGMAWRREYWMIQWAAFQHGKMAGIDDSSKMEWLTYYRHWKNRDYGILGWTRSMGIGFTGVGGVSSSLIAAVPAASLGYICQHSFGRYQT